MTDEIVWNTATTSCHNLVNTFRHELVLHKQPFWEAADPCKVFFFLFAQITGIMMLVKKKEWHGFASKKVKDSFEIQSSASYIENYSREKAARLK